MNRIKGWSDAVALRLTQGAVQGPPAPPQAYLHACALSPLVLLIQAEWVDPTWRAQCTSASEHILASGPCRHCWAGGA